MMRADVIDLITETASAHGVHQAVTETARTVYCTVQSVSRSEFYAGGETGFRPELRFTVFQAEYQGEETLVWNGATYAVYRTYQVPGTDDLELYAQRKVGVHYGGQNAD